MSQTTAQSRKVPASFAAHAMLASGSRLPRVCIVTGEIVGPFKNGGLGTSMTGLAELLAAHGAQVTVIYTGTIAPADLPQWQRSYLQAGIILEDLSRSESRKVIGPMASVQWTNAWGLYQLLRLRQYDVIHFNDTVGEGVFCFVAKRMGLAFSDTLLCLALHSPTEWILEGNGHSANWLGFSYFTTAERISIAATDLLWGPSRYLINWIISRGYTLPAEVFCQQYVIPTGELFSSGPGKCRKAAIPSPQVEPRKCTEIVFFGRLEERKGIRLFTAAITRIGGELARRRIRVVFMGKPSSVGGHPAEKFLQARCRHWPFKWGIESSLGQQEAVAYLREKNCVAVIASPLDNSPCTVYEALQFGIPFLAARTGGIPELIHSDDHARHLFDYSVTSLTEHLLAAIIDGIGVARSAIPVAENQNRWLGFHAAWRDYLSAPRKAVQERTIALLIDHASSENMLALTLESCRQALGSRLVAIIVLSRELTPTGIFDNTPDSMLIDELTDLGPRDALAFAQARKACGLLCVRSGVRMAPSAGPILDQGLACGAVALIPAVAIEESDNVMPSLAGSAAISFLEGDYDTGAALISLEHGERFWSDAVTELDRERLYFGVLDELLAVDARVWPIPEPLVSVRDIKELIIQPYGAVRRTHAFARAPHRERYQILGISRDGYRLSFPVRAPAAPTKIVELLGHVESSIAVRSKHNLREMARKAILLVFGVRGVARATVIFRRLRGG